MDEVTVTEVVLLEVPYWALAAVGAGVAAGVAVAARRRSRAKRREL